MDTNGLKTCFAFFSPVFWPEGVAILAFFLSEEGVFNTVSAALFFPDSGFCTHITSIMYTRATTSQ
jgi:hypothetical protein